MEKVARVPMTEFTQWSGAATGLCGAALLAVQNAYSGWGFVLFLISNFFWIAFGLMIHARGLLVMQAGFTSTSVFGLLNAFFDGVATKTVLVVWYGAVDIWTKAIELFASVARV